nr:208_t:CDS:2 [Entrophospora candida]
MPCLVNLIVYITETRKIPTINNFVMNAAVGVTKSSTGEEHYVDNLNVKFLKVMATNLTIMELENEELKPSDIVVTMTAIAMNQHGRDDSSSRTVTTLNTVEATQEIMSSIENPKRKKKGKAPAASIRTKVKIQKLANLAVQNIDDGECSTPVADNDEDNE